MESIKDKLRKDYPNIDNLNDLDIRKIVSDIWNKYLEDNHAYLIIDLTSEMLDFDPFSDIISNNIKGFTFDVNLLNKEYVKDKSLKGWGLIVNIDWMSIKPIFLPEDLNNRKITVTGKYTLTNVFSVNDERGIINSSYDSAKTLSEDTGLPLIKIDVYSYDENYKMNSDILIDDVIGYYLDNKNILGNYNRKQQLVSKYGKYILSEYLKAINDGSFNDEVFLHQITSYIDQKEGIKIIV